VDTNPATKVIPPKLKNRTVKTIKYFDNNELKRFLNYLNTFELTVNNQLNVTLYNFLLATGLRVGEALALNWSHIDFINNTVRVSKTLLQNGTLQNTPKTRESNRLISLDTHTLSLLKKLKLRQSKDILSLVDVKVFSCFGISYSYT
ncbi:tyrosine-type recombinase/integrase, partial [Campylobacter jejuni]|uniref:tyrosine-type recombinase/integrase n=1 Tax=Campylobacter jejuni TaxID=197 RepID=UPI002B229268